MAFGRCNRERDDTVHANRQVVLRDAVRLEQRYIYVCIGLHVRSNGELDRSLPIVAHMLGGREDTRTVLDADDRATSFDGREGDDDLFSWHVCILVCLESEHIGGGRAISVTPSFTVRPIEIAHHTGGVFALFVFHRNEIGSPISIGISQVEGGHTIRTSTDGEGFHRFVVRIRDIVRQAPVI